MIGGAAEAKSRRAPEPTAAAARDAYYSGDIEKAFELAPRVEERWIAGLAAFRLQKFTDARRHFETVAHD